MTGLERLWMAGTSGQPPGIRRQVALTNQIGLFGTVVTIPYQLFYLLYDFGLYHEVIFANLVFIAGYLSPLWLNQRGRHTRARNLVLLNTCSQLFVVTYFISAGAGVHFFYFTIASVMAFMFQPLRTGRFCLQMSGLGLLFLISHLRFPAGLGAAPVPSPFIEVMFTGSVIGVLTLISLFTFLLRRDFDTAEAELRVRNEDLETLSSTDQLTELPNRRQLDETLIREWARARRERQPLTVIMCDVDYFKSYNDSLGHKAGDQCLQRIAAALRSMLVRPTDLVARFGGEEFALVLPDTDADGARQLAERLRKRVESLAIPHPDAPSGKVVTVSLGVTTATAPVDGDPERLLWRADEALYQAKEKGRNSVDFLPFTREAGRRFSAGSG